MTELEESLKSSQLKNQRMEEVFHKYCSDFRRGIFHLFGYQVDCDEGNYKLTSVYSEDPQDFLSFKVLLLRFSSNQNCRVLQKFWKKYVILTLDYSDTSVRL